MSWMTTRAIPSPPISAEQALRVSARLDARFHELKGDAVVTDKERAFRDLFRVLEGAGIRYALIGGVAIQFWRSEPRTTLDIDVAVLSYDDVPRDALAAAGFRFLARHEHSENWLGPDDVPVQFTDDPTLALAVQTAAVRTLADGVVRVAIVVELVRAKLRAAHDPARRRSKRLQDLADAEALIEDHPAVRGALTDAERSLLQTLL